jgi:hypothetical protein
VLRNLWVIDGDTGGRARKNRERTIASVLNVFAGHGFAGGTTENIPGSKWVAWNAIAEQLDYGRRYTARTNQVPRHERRNIEASTRWLGYADRGPARLST